MEKMASEVDAGGTLTLKGTPLAELRVTDLKRELEHRGLSKSGSKIQLIERLKAQLLLEKLQQEAAQSSGDEHEGKVPNIALQQDDKAGQSEFVRQYLQQQQRNLEIQMEVKKQFEEERKRRSADDESSAEDDPRPTHVADDNPELTSPKQFKDDTSNAPAKEASKMPRPIRKSNRNSLKGESGPVADQGRSRPESPKIEKGRQRRRSSSSPSSRSPSPDRPSQNRRGRPTKAATRKVERSRSSSSSTEEESPKKKQRSRNSSGSRSPNTASTRMPAQQPHRRSDADQAAEKDIPYDGSGDQPVGKNENSEKAMAASSRKKWRKKQPLAPAVVESTNASQRRDSATADDTKERQNPHRDNTNGKDKSDRLVEEEQDVREVVAGSGLSTAVASLPAEKSGTSSGRTQQAASGLEKSKLISEENSQKQEHSLKQKDEVDERIVETASTKGPPKSPRKQHSRSSSTDSSSARSKSRSKSPTRKKGKGSRSSSSSSSDSETRSSGSSSDSSVDGSHKKASKANGQAQTACRKVSLTQEKGDKAEQMEVEVASKSPATSKTGHTDRDYKPSSVQTSPSGEPRSKSQEEKQNNLDKEQENRSTDAKEERGDTHSVIDENSSTVTVSSEKAKDADEETAAKKGVKKRKWNSKASKAGKTTKRTSSMEISSDVLKNLIGDVKLTETVFEMETEVVNDLDYDDQEEDQRDVRVKKAPSPTKEVKPEEEDARKVETRDPSPESAAATASEPEKKIIKLSSAAPKVAAKTKVKKSKGDKKGDAAGKKEKKQDVADTEPKEKVVATNRVIKPLMPVVDEPEPVTGRQSPPRNPPDRVIRIAGLVRPFTVNQLKELLRRSGELDDEYFWISDIKSHCLAAYKTPEQAMAARAALHGTRWPQSNPKILFVDFATIDDVIHRKQEGKVPPPALINKRPQEEQKIKEPKIVEKEEKKHKAKEPKEKTRIERDRIEREKEERETKDRKREPEKKNFVREWDRDKIQQLSRSRSKSKDRERPARRSRSREREQRKRGEYKDKREDERRKEKKQKEAKAEEEPPAKLLDDLFRKTKATPCIYWLPLTEEQAQVRMAKRLEEEKERQKKLAAAEEREKEELRKRETARLERQREREKARDKDRDRSKPDRKASRSSSRSRSRRRR